MQDIEVNEGVAEGGDSARCVRFHAGGDGILRRMRRGDTTYKELPSYPAQSSSAADGHHVIEDFQTTISNRPPTRLRSGAATAVDYTVASADCDDDDDMEDAY